MIGKLRALALRIYAWLEKQEWAWKLFVRVAAGLMYFGGAVKVLGDLPGFVKYFEDLGIPAAKIQAPFVVGTELVASVLLMIGLFTRPAAVALSCIMLVAIATAGVPEHKITASWSGLLDFLYLPDWLLFLLLVWLVFSGPGKASVDAWLSKRYPASAPK